VGAAPCYAIREGDWKATMKIRRRDILQFAAAAPALSILPSVAGAQDWPTRVVRLLVGFPPGGGADAAARLVANRLSKIWGRQVIVENKPGAGGNIAIDTAARANPDGYTMVLATGAHRRSTASYSDRLVMIL